jgi:acyl-CoA thioesterase YciA
LKQIQITTTKIGGYMQLDPEGELTLQTVTFPADTNSSGDIFGGWVLSQMDIAAGITAAQRAKGRCATVAINEMRFHAPFHVGDLFSVYAVIVKTGKMYACAGSTH